jgi:glutamate synthase (NADPH/NADH) small chain
MEYLYGRNRAVAGTAEPTLTATGKHVIVVGGGDTGADCVASAHREGAASVTQIELLGEPPPTRPDDVTPWPSWPAKLRTSYALEEGGEREFAISTARLRGNGRVEEIHWTRNSGAPPFESIAGTDETRPAELVLLAMGFVGPEPGLLDELGVERDARGNIATTNYESSVPGVFAAGDARRGQSLIVWAIEEGRKCAAAVETMLRSASEQPPTRLANTA